MKIDIAVIVPQDSTEPYVTFMGLKMSRWEALKFAADIAFLADGNLIDSMTFGAIENANAMFKRPTDAS